MPDYNSELSNFLQFLTIVAVSGVPGILGGLTKAVSPYLNSERAAGEKAKPQPWQVYFANAVTGFGGAMSAVLVTLWAKRFPKFPLDVEAYLLLFTTGYIAGYIANKLLPAIADQVYDQLTKLKKEQQEIAKQAKTDTQNSTNLSTQLTRAYDYLERKLFFPDETKSLIQSLTELVAIYPDNRLLNILLGRLWDEAAHNRTMALEAMRRFIGVKLGMGQKDDDLATAYWNAANYLEDEFKVSKAPELRSQAIEAVRNAIACAEHYRDVYLNDGDFEEIRGMPEGMALLQRSPDANKNER
jgi:hypothetical protein